MIDNRNLLDHSVELGSSVMSVYVTLAVRSLIHVTILVAMNVRSDFGGPSALVHVTILVATNVGRDLGGLNLTSPEQFCEVVSSLWSFGPIVSWNHCTQ